VLGRCSGRARFLPCHTTSLIYAIAPPQLYDIAHDGLVPASRAWTGSNRPDEGPTMPPPRRRSAALDVVEALRRPRRGRAVERLAGPCKPVGSRRVGFRRKVASSCVLADTGPLALDATGPGGRHRPRPLNRPARAARPRERARGASSPAGDPPRKSIVKPASFETGSSNILHGFCRADAALVRRPTAERAKIAPAWAFAG